MSAHSKKTITLSCVLLMCSGLMTGQWSPTLSTPNRGITPPPNSGSQCVASNTPSSCPTYNVAGMNWYLTAPDPSRPITINWSSLGNHDWVMTMPSGFIEWEDPDGLVCVNSQVINIQGLGPVQMNFAAVKFGSDNATSDGHVNFGYRVNGGSWVVSSNFSIAGTNTGGSWTQSTSGNTLEIRACADFGGQNQDTRLTVFNTNLGAPLPVRWDGIFGVLDKDGSARIEWKTFSETNNDYFEVERSMDGIGFENVGRVSGSGNTNDLRSYTFIDKSVTPGNLYHYRIKQVDFDGRYDYSSQVKISTKTRQIGIHVHPNPIEQWIKIELDNDQNQIIELTIYAINGKKIRNIQIESDQYFVETDISDLPPGAYFLSSNIHEIKPIKIFKVSN